VNTFPESLEEIAKLKNILDTRDTKALVGFVIIHGVEEYNKLLTFALSR
jgi:hypothetical protein